MENERAREQASRRSTKQAGGKSNSNNAEFDDVVSDRTVEMKQADSARGPIRKFSPPYNQSLSRSERSEEHNSSSQIEQEEDENEYKQDKKNKKGREERNKGRGEDKEDDKEEERLRAAYGRRKVEQAEPTRAGKAPTIGFDGQQVFLNFVELERKHLLAKVAELEKDNQELSEQNGNFQIRIKELEIQLQDVSEDFEKSRQEGEQKSATINDFVRKAAEFIKSERKPRRDSAVNGSITNLSTSNGNANANVNAKFDSRVQSQTHLQSQTQIQGQGLKSFEQRNFERTRDGRVNRFTDAHYDQESASESEAPRFSHPNQNFNQNTNFNQNANTNSNFNANTNSNTNTNTNVARRQLSDPLNAQLGQTNANGRAQRGLVDNPYRTVEHLSPNDLMEAEVGRSPTFGAPPRKAAAQPPLIQTDSRTDLAWRPQTGSFHELSGANAPPSYNIYGGEQSQPDSTRNLKVAEDLGALRQNLRSHNDFVADFNKDIENILNRNKPAGSTPGPRLNAPKNSFGLAEFGGGSLSGRGDSAQFGGLASLSRNIGSNSNANANAFGGSRSPVELYSNNNNNNKSDNLLENYSRKYGPEGSAFNDLAASPHDRKPASHQKARLEAVKETFFGDVGSGLMPGIMKYKKN